MLFTVFIKVASNQQFTDHNLGSEVLHVFMRKLLFYVLKNKNVDHVIDCQINAVIPYDHQRDMKPLKETRKNICILFYNLGCA